MKNIENTSLNILDIITKRCSACAFDVNKIIEDQVLLKILEAARWAPSSYNEQPWYFLVTNKHEDSFSWGKVYDSLVSQNKAWAFSAPVFLVIVVKKNFTIDLNGENFHAQYDCGAAVMSALIQAISMGIVSHQIGGFQMPSIRKHFHIPEGYTPLSLVALGYPSTQFEDLPESVLQRIKSPRIRKGLHEFCFKGKWGTPYIGA